MLNLRNTENINTRAAFEMEFAEKNNLISVKRNGKKGQIVFENEYFFCEPIIENGNMRLINKFLQREYKRSYCYFNRDKHLVWDFERF